MTNDVTWLQKVRVVTPIYLEPNISKTLGWLDWIERGLTSPPIQYRLSGRQFYRWKDPTNSIKVLKEKLASHRPEEAPNPPGASHRVTSEPLKKQKPYRPIHKKFKMANWQFLNRSRVSNTSREQKWNVLIEAGGLLLEVCWRWNTWQTQWLEQLVWHFRTMLADVQPTDRKNPHNRG